jgi:hypothetical protein
MIRNTTWKKLALRLLIAGGAGLLTWLLSATVTPSIRVLLGLGPVLLTAALDPTLAAVARARTRRQIAERICTADAMRRPRWSPQAMQKTISEASVKALIAEHNRIARDVECTIIALGYRRADARRAIAVARYEHLMFSHEGLLDFARKTLSAEGAHITQVSETPGFRGSSMEPKQRSHGAGC